MLPSFYIARFITGFHNEDEPIFDAFLASSRKNRKFQFACLCLDSTIPCLNRAPRYLVLKIVQWNLY